jgi:hypothetical protein
VRLKHRIGEASKIAAILIDIWRLEIDVTR